MSAALFEMSERIATIAGLKEGQIVSGMTLKFRKPLKRRFFDTGTPATPNTMRKLASLIKSSIRG